MARMILTVIARSRRKKRKPASVAPLRKPRRPSGARQRWAKPKSPHGKISQNRGRSNRATTHTPVYRRNCRCAGARSRCFRAALAAVDRTNQIEFRIGKIPAQPHGAKRNHARQRLTRKSAEPRIVNTLLIMSHVSRSAGPDATQLARRCARMEEVL